MEGFSVTKDSLAPIEKMLDSILKIQAELELLKKEQAKYAETIQDDISRDAEAFTIDISRNADLLIKKLKASLEMQEEALQQLNNMEKGGIR